MTRTLRALVVLSLVAWTPELEPAATEESVS